MATASIPVLKSFHQPIQITPPLRNPRHERFAQLCAAGISPTEAYVSTGFSESGAAQSAHNLLKRTDVQNRIAYLQRSAADSVVNKAIFTKERVLHRLDILSRESQAAKNYSAAINAEISIGKELGMFRDTVDHNFKWDGDLNKLSEGQKAQLWLSLEAIAFKDNPAGLAAFQAETDSMMKTIEASSEEVVGSHEEANIADGTGENGLLPAAGPVSDTADSGRRINDIPSLPEGDG